MSEQILITLKRKLDNLVPYGSLDAETKRNAIKEDLQFYVLNFIYHHAKYSKWIMYGGSALRICHGLNRMSVDLDFEVAHPVNKKFLSTLKKEIENYFTRDYGAEIGFLTIKTTIGRGLLLKFHIGDKLNIGHHSTQVHVKIDLNHFVAQNTAIERIPINHDQLSFVIVTYNMSSLMASKIAAIFLRGTRGVGKAVYEEKGRDIYDLLWYMNKKIIPNLDYLIEKGVDAKNLHTLFNKLTLRMNRVNDTNLKQDLTPLFVDQTYIANWLKNWRESYLRLFDAYSISIVTKLESVVVHKDFDTDNFSFVYWYHTEGRGTVRIIYTISHHWITFPAGDLPTKINDRVIELVSGDIEGQLSEKLKQYVTLFYEKTEAYFKKTNRVLLGDGVATRIIRMTADNLNQKEEIMLNKPTLLSSELDDLLK